MNSLKESIFDQILFSISGFSNEDMMNIQINGPPGCGKSTVCHIIADIYCKMGILPTNNVVVAQRKDLIGQYLGTTDKKTTKILESALGGVLLIDEAYSLGNPEKRDSFSRECINTINEFLTINKGKLACIICGYEEEIEQCFFSYNPGLKRRFTWKYVIDRYTGKDLMKIFLQQLRKDRWFLKDDSTKVWLSNFFEEKVKTDTFPFAGGDTDILATKVKICHSRRIFGNKSIEDKERFQKKIFKMDLKFLLKIENLKMMKIKSHQVECIFNILY